jgi:predicted ester cyclase
MSTKDLGALARRLLSEGNKGKAAAIAALDETCAADAVMHYPSEDIRGLKDFKKHMSELYDALPDIHWTLDDMLVEGDRVAVRWTVSGTHKGKLMGIPPTNKKVKYSGIEIDRVAGGKFVEGWVSPDTLGFMQQLGVVPAPGKRK